jgi:RNA polymerase sigma-70 factor (ECF subfamily)
MEEADFEALAARYRRELELHCYRLLGSVQEAEDVLQETLLAAWRAADGFRGEASPRTWLYRIATNRSLDALRRGRRRPQTSEVAGRPPGLPASRHRFDAPWLEPYPDSLLPEIEDEAASPDARYESREAIGLAFIVALQTLSGRQRAVLVLRDVLGFSAAETAEILETTVPSVTSALNRARRAMAARDGSRMDVAASGQDGADRRVIAEFVEAFEHGEVAQVVALLADDAIFAMPPTPDEYRGPAQIAAFLGDRFRWRGTARLTLMPTRANGEAAFACYLHDPLSPAAWAHGLLVVSVRRGQITALTRFLGDDVLRRFHLPSVLSAPR